MNPPTESGSGQSDRQPAGQAAQDSARLTHTLFRLFVIAVLGSFFVFQLDVGYVWLTALLTVAGIVLGIVVLVRAVKYKESRLVLYGAISGLVGRIAGFAALAGGAGLDTVLQPDPRLPAVRPLRPDAAGNLGMQDATGEVPADATAHAAALTAAPTPR